MMVTWTSRLNLTLLDAASKSHFTHTPSWGSQGTKQSLQCLLLISACRNLSRGDAQLEQTWSAYPPELAHTHAQQYASSPTSIVWLNVLLIVAHGDSVDLSPSVLLPFIEAEKEMGIVQTGGTFLAPERISKCQEHKTESDGEATDLSM
jgi:hypothetical protein